MTRYDRFPDHPLAGIPQEVLDECAAALDAAFDDNADPETMAHTAIGVFVSRMRVLRASVPDTAAIDADLTEAGLDMTLTYPEWDGDDIRQAWRQGYRFQQKGE